jgi:hypothetical protein
MQIAKSRMILNKRDCIYVNKKIQTSVLIQITTFSF